MRRVAARPHSGELEYTYFHSKSPVSNHWKTPIVDVPDQRQRDRDVRSLGVRSRRPQRSRMARGTIRDRGQIT